jgi:hypothetical protein
MAKDIVHETMHEMLAFDLLMDAGGDRQSYGEVQGGAADAADG